MNTRNRLEKLEAHLLRNEKGPDYLWNSPPGAQVIAWESLMSGVTVTRRSGESDADLMERAAQADRDAAGARFNEFPVRLMLAIGENFSY